MNPGLPPIIPSLARHRRYIFFKLAGICALIAALLVPLSLTRGVLRERQSYQRQATEEIAAVWGRQQLVTGPVLAVPYSYRAMVMRSKLVNGKAVQVEEAALAMSTAFFLPETLSAKGRITPEIRKRGIYETVVYGTTLNLDAGFQPDFGVAGIEAERIDWDRARLILGVTDVHGVRSVSWSDPESKHGSFESTDGVADAFLPLGAKVVGLSNGVKSQFALSLSLQGSDRFEIAPVGKSTLVSLDSPWRNPSFTGASLPLSRQVSGEGFRAEWQNSHFSRGFPQSWNAVQMTGGQIAGKIAASGYGVRFAQPVDGYSMVDRAQKYGVLFFVLTFAVFFLFETTAALRIHPLQYALVGGALCLFFIAFLALSEFWTTGLAYTTAAIGCTGMITLYAGTFLKTGWRTLVIASGLGATYGYLYFVLKSQDYALIAGTAALFVGMALVMFCTRKINWYAVEAPVART
ncbi:MAG: cell envelope integrity protein CreD [Opitutus sp.]